MYLHSSKKYLLIIISTRFLKKNQSVLLADRCQKQPFVVVLQNRCSEQFRDIRRKTPVLESPFNAASGLQETPTQVLSCEYCEIFKNSFVYRAPLVAAFKI